MSVARAGLGHAALLFGVLGKLYDFKQTHFFADNEAQNMVNDMALKEQLMIGSGLLVFGFVEFAWCYFAAYGLNKKQLDPSS